MTRARPTPPPPDTDNHVGPARAFGGFGFIAEFRARRKLVKAAALLPFTMNPAFLRSVAKRLSALKGKGPREEAAALNIMADQQDAFITKVRS